MTWEEKPKKGIKLSVEVYHSTLLSLIELQYIPQVHHPSELQQIASSFKRIQVTAMLPWLKAISGQVPHSIRDEQKSWLIQQPIPLLYTWADTAYLLKPHQIVI